MLIIPTATKDLDNGDLFLSKIDNVQCTYRVVRNAGDCVLVEMLIPKHEFYWWDIEKEGNVFVDVIQSK